MSISSILINWYLEKKRNLPWRNTSNPYYIWVSEVILQQTRVAQGLNYYERFIDRFPDIQSLANADIIDVLKFWQGLGYYTRARNLHAGAKYVVQQLHGVMPADYAGLLQIKGVGEYTAAAIGSIAYNIPKPVVDGNVNRVIARIFGIHNPINSTLGLKSIKNIAQTILDQKNPSLHNQAIMEFGALQCVIRNPNCDICPLNNECYAWQHKEVELLPQKTKRQKIRNRYFNYMVILYHNNIVLSKRSTKDIWHGLYEFPLIETDHAMNEIKLMSTAEWKSLFGDTDYHLVEVSKKYKHQLTHQKLNARFFVIAIKDKPNALSKKTILVKKEDIHQYPVPKLIDNYLHTLNFKNY